MTALHFTSPFASRRDRERGLQAVRTAKELGVPLIFREKGNDYLEIIKKPQYGYGKNMNPCIDCRIYMLKVAKTVMEEEGADFVATGEVLGQRPMSQMRHTITLIEHESGLTDLIVRPLSAKLFQPSKAEREGLVDRSKLLDVAGRSRKAQNELATRFGLTEFGHPAGGCLLTDPIYASKLRDLADHDPGFTVRDIDYLNIGRHFRINDTTKVIVGRDEEENNRLESLSHDPYVFYRPCNFKGPSAVARGTLSDENIIIIAHIMAFFSKHSGDIISIETGNSDGRTMTVARQEFDIDTYRIEGVP